MHREQSMRDPVRHAISIRSQLGQDRLSMSSPSSEFSRPAKMTGLPELPYTLQTRKCSIAIIWSALIVITCLQIEFFYFLLRYGTNSNEENALENALTVPTSILLGLSILSICFRVWQLARPSSKVRPLGGSWYGLDFFGWNAIVGFVIVTAVLSAATAEEPKNIRQASMPQAIVLFLASSQLVVTGIMAKLGLKTPVRFSSTTRGSVMKPGVYVLIEDIVAVDGGGGQEFREALLARYESSKDFQRLAEQMNWFWGIGSILVAGGTTAIVYAVDDLNVVFALGWCIPWVWAGTGAVVSVVWTKRVLRLEQERWMNTQV